MVKDLPVKINKIKIKERHLHYYVIRCGEKWVWKKRSSGDIWEGLFDFPHVEQTKENSESEFNLPEAAKTPVKFPKNYRHILSHQKLNAVFSEVEFPEEKIAHLNEWAENNGFLLVEEEKIEYLAKPKLIVNFLNDQGF
jgi:A/G-specific adenine glycosylase